MHMDGAQSDPKNHSKPTPSFHSHPVLSAAASHPNHNTIRPLIDVYSVLLLLKVYARPRTLTFIPQQPHPNPLIVSFVKNEPTTLFHLNPQNPSTP